MTCAKRPSASPFHYLFVNLYSGFSARAKNPCTTRPLNKSTNKKLASVESPLYHSTSGSQLYAHKIAQMDLQTLTNLFATTYNPDPNIRKSAELQIRKVLKAFASPETRYHCRNRDRSLECSSFCRLAMRRVFLLLFCRLLETKTSICTCRDALSMWHLP